MAVSSRWVGIGSLGGVYQRSIRRWSDGCKGRLAGLRQRRRQGLFPLVLRPEAQALGQPLAAVGPGLGKETDRRRRYAPASCGFRSGR